MFNDEKFFWFDRKASLYYVHDEENNIIENSFRK